MKKKLIALLICLCFSLGLNCSYVSAEEVNQIRIIYPYAYVYEQPNAGNQDIVKIKTCNYNDVLTLNKTEVVIGNEDTFEYYEVIISDVSGYNVGYVLKSQAVDVNTQSPKKDLATNATVSSECDVYTFDGTDYNKTNVKLAKDTKIRILSGYKADVDYTHIQYLDSDKNIVTAYVKTQNIYVAGVSRATIGAIIIIATTISLALIIFGISGKRKKKKLA